MHIYTLFSVALASILVSFASASSFDKESSVVGIHQGANNHGSRRSLYKKREIRKRLSSSNSENKQHTDHSLVARSGAGGTSNQPLIFSGIVPINGFSFLRVPGSTLPLGMFQAVSLMVLQRLTAEIISETRYLIVDNKRDVDTFLTARSRHATGSLNSNTWFMLQRMLYIVTDMISKYNLTQLEAL
ncbi:hypothetical protein BDF21DRAFT_396621 [Thamnidium elegans]|nr:hypothetical protein BDF21DRAFT_396621 [Thamnidium elegans]